MNARNEHETRGRATGIRAAVLIVVVGTLAAVWHPITGHQLAEAVANAATEASVAAPTMSLYFPSRFAAPESVEPQAPTL